MTPEFVVLLTIILGLDVGCAILAVGVAALKALIDLPFASRLIGFFLHISEITTGALIGALGAYLSTAGHLP